jgi:ribosome-associated toxin RatA of RatAB toxin-antitoxin module
MRIAPSFGRPAAMAVLVALLVPGIAPGAPPDGRLETRVTREGRLLHVQATLDADAPSKLCFAVLADYDRLEEFVPGLVSSDVVSEPGQPILLHQVGNASAGPFDYTLDVTLAVRESAPRLIEFERVDGNLRQMKGRWKVSGDPAHCGIDYQAQIEPAFWVPPLIGPMLMRNRVETQLEGVLEEIHRRAHSQAAP